MGTHHKDRRTHTTSWENKYINWNIRGGGGGGGGGELKQNNNKNKRKVADFPLAASSSWPSRWLSQRISVATIY